MASERERLRLRDILEEACEAAMAGTLDGFNPYIDRILSRTPDSDTGAREALERRVLTYLRNMPEEHREAWVRWVENLPTDDDLVEIRAALAEPSVEREPDGWDEWTAEVAHIEGGRYAVGCWHPEWGFVWTREEDGPERMRAFAEAFPPRAPTPDPEHATEHDTSGKHGKP